MTARVAAAVLGIALAACGVKAPPRPPERAAAPAGAAPTPTPTPSPNP